MVLAGTVVALLSASDVSITIPSGTRCVERRSLIARLEASGLRVGAASKRLSVAVRSDEGSLVVTGQRQGPPFERRVSAGPEDCGAVERVVAALIISWSSQLPAAEAASARRPPPSPPPITTADVGEQTADPEPEAVVEERPAPAVEELPERTPLPSPRVEVVGEPREAAPEQKPSLFALDLAALGGGSLGPTPAVAGIGQLSVGASVGLFGVLLEGGLQSARIGEVGATRVESYTQWLSLSARLRFEPVRRLKLDVAAGFRIWRITAASFNTVDPKSKELLGLGGVISAGAALRVATPLSIHLRAFGSLRASRPRFLIGTLGPVLDLQPGEGGLLLGLEFHVL